MYRKTVLLIVVVFALCSSAAFGIVPMGPPAAVLKEGQLSIGFDYGYSKADIDFAGEMDGVDAEGTFEDMRSNSLMGRLGYGLYPYGGNWDAYLLFGAASADQNDFDGDYGFSGGFATKVTLFKGGNLSFGALYQMQWSRSRGSFTADPNVLFNISFPELEPGVVDLDAEVDWFEIQAATGPTYQMGGLRIYGGPVLYYIDGDIEYDIADTDLSFSIDFDEKVKFGRYAGIELNLGDNSYLYFEYQATDDAEAAGGGICWKF